MLMCAACSTLTSIPKLYRVKMMITAPTFPLTFTNNPLSFTSSMTKLNYPLHVHLSSLIFQSSLPRKSHLGLISCSQSSITRRSKGSFDPELRLVLELATDSELYELERILFGPSYFSPLLKSVTSRADVDYVMIGEDYEEREYFFELLESRFVYLAADARSTLRGWRPSYREILLSVRRKLGVPCSSKLSTEDLEVEIFLHLLQEYSSRETDDILHTWEDSEINNSSGGVELGLNQQKVQTSAAMRIGAAELKSMILKAGGVFTLGKIYQVVARRLSGKMLLEAANYQIKNEIIKEGGKLAALSLEPRAALFAAKKGLAGAASRFLGLRSMMMLLGPMLWGTFLADVVIQMLGTDYARILRAIYAFAQIRITRTYKLASQKDQLL